MDDWLIEPFGRSRHDRTAFQSGEPSLDRFLRELVTQYEQKRIGRSYVLVRKGEAPVLGYYTIAASSIMFDKLPKALTKKLRRYPVPSLLIARLAVDQTHKGQGLGKELLFDALHRAASLSNSMGLHFVEVHALHEQAAQFYEHFGFIPLPDDPLHLVMSIQTILAT